MKEFCPYCQNDPVTHMQQKEICGTCEMETKAAKRKITKADRIRSMSDEELARLANKIETESRAYGIKGRAAWLEWLKKECE